MGFFVMREIWPLTPALSRRRGSLPKCLKGYIDLMNPVDYGFNTNRSSRRNPTISPNQFPLPLGEG